MDRRLAVDHHPVTWAVPSSSSWGEGCHQASSCRRRGEKCPRGASDSLTIVVGCFWTRRRWTIEQLLARLAECVQGVRVQGVVDVGRCDCFGGGGWIFGWCLIVCTFREVEVDRRDRRRRRRSWKRGEGRGGGKLGDWSVVWLLENWKSSLAVSISDIYIYIYICFRKLKVEERWIDDRSMMELRDKFWNSWLGMKFLITVGGSKDWNFNDLILWLVGFYWK